eukprot:gene8705-11763_t
MIRRPKKAVSDVDIINHALTLSDYHGGSMHLKNALTFIKGLFTKKNSKSKQFENDAFTDQRQQYEKAHPKKESKPPKQTQQEEYKPPPKQQQEYRPPPQQQHPNQQHYNTLGLNSNATNAEITRAYRKLALIHHPDKPTGNNQKFQEINNAYHALMGEVISGNSTATTIASDTTTVNTLILNENPSAYTTSSIYQSYYNLCLINGGGSTNGNANIILGFDQTNPLVSVNTGYTLFNSLAIFNDGLQVSSGQTITTPSLNCSGTLNTSSLVASSAISTPSITTGLSGVNFTTPNISISLNSGSNMLFNTFEGAGFYFDQPVYVSEDSRIAHIKDSLEFGVIAGPGQNTFQSFPSNSASTSSIIFNIQVPSMSTVIDRECVVVGPLEVIQNPYPLIRFISQVLKARHQILLMVENYPKLPNETMKIATPALKRGATKVLNTVVDRGVNYMLNGPTPTGAGIRKKRPKGTMVGRPSRKHQVHTAEEHIPTNQNHHGGKFNFIKTMKSVGRVVAPIAQKVGSKLLNTAIDHPELAMMALGAGVKKRRQPSKRNLLIKQLMAHHGCTLAEASKHIKTSGMQY